MNSDEPRINSNAYWDSRFSGNWETCEGPRQSRFFAKCSIERLPAWFLDQIKRNSLTVVDWGCAQGDGTDVWASCIDARQLTGIDFSAVAIEQASERYPTIRFHAEDWLMANSGQSEVFDVVFSSNTLEHFLNPYEVLEIIASRARKAIVLALPYREVERIDEHFVSFIPENIPLILKNGFRLEWARVFDCRYIPNTLWGGDQIVLLYSDPKWVASLGLHLSDCHIEESDSESMSARLREAVAERDGQIAGLTQSVAERDGQITNLNQVVVDRDVQIAGLNHAIAELDAQVAGLKQSVLARENEVLEIYKSRSWRITSPMRALVIFFRSPKEFSHSLLCWPFWKLSAGLRRALDAPRHRFVRFVRSLTPPNTQVGGSASAADLLWEEFNQRILTNRDKYKGIFIQELAIDWNVSLFQRPQHIAAALGRMGYLVIYRTGNWAGADATRGFREVSTNVWISNRKEVSSIEGAVRSLYSTAYMHSPEALVKREKDVLVYEYIDHIDPGISGDEKNIRRLIHLKNFAFGGGADYIIASAKKLYQEAVDAVGPRKVLLVPNGVDTSHYRNPDHKNTELPIRLVEFNRKHKTIIGYFGALAPWLWYEAIAELVASRRDLGFVFIGPDYSGGASKLPQADNVLQLGAIDYKILPAYAKTFDVCFIPFKPGEIARTTSPLKLFEYFALEKPVVVTADMAECVQYPEVFRGASVSELSTAIDSAIAVKDDRRFKQRLAELADENDWTQRALILNECFNELQKHNQGLAGGNYRFILRLKRTLHYVKRSVQLISSSGIHGFAEALTSKVKRRHAGNTTNYIQPNISFGINIDSVDFPRLEVQKNQAETFLLDGELVIIAGVPFDDVGGGQRAAQLARCALKTGRRVVYMYIYKKFDFELHQHVESTVSAYGLQHVHIDSISPSVLLKDVSSRATLLVELPHRSALPYLRLFNMRGMRTVFELIDDWETSLGGDWFDYEIYRSFVLEAQYLVGTAKLLVQRLTNLGRADTLYLPNAANEYIFDKYKSYSRPVDMPSGSRRTGLYFGSLYGEWFAWGYLEEAAKQNPDCAFLLIGDRPAIKKELPENVHMLGAKLIDELSAYLSHSDFAILPFLPGKISDAVSPIKVFEYLFAGKPVVSTNLPELDGYPGVAIGHSPQEFAYLCSKASGDDFSQHLNDQFIFRNSWFSRLDSIIGQAENTRFKQAVSVIILVHNNKKIIGRCLESLLFHCGSYLKEVIVVDNASSDGCAEYIRRNFPTVLVIKNPINGCSSGRNLGVKSASGDYLVFVDSDQWFTSSCAFEEALSILERDPNVGALGWAAGWFDSSKSDLGGMIADCCPNRAMNENAVRMGYRSDIGYLGTGGVFIPKSVFDATDGFDVSYDPTCFEDTDLSFQIKRLGFDVCYRDLTGIRHQPHQTTQANLNSSSYHRLFSRNAAYLKKKWVDYPNFFLDYPA